MTNWTMNWMAGPLASPRRTRLLRDPSLSVALTGSDALSTWELRDGRRVDSDGAPGVAVQLIVDDGLRLTQAERSGPPVKHSTDARVEAIASRRVAHLVVRCGLAIAGVELRRDDGTAQRSDTVLSAATGERLAVLSLDSPARAERLRLLDDRGAVIDERPVADPRLRLV